MSDVISLDWIAARLRAIQAEQRTLRSENELLRTTIMNTMSEVLRLLSERIGNFEALMEARIERVEARLDRLEITMESRFAQFGAQLDRIEGILRPGAAP
jgi:hypothetical protein